MQFFNILSQSIFHRCAEFYPSSYEGFFTNDFNLSEPWEDDYTAEQCEEIIIALSIATVVCPKVLERLSLLWTEYPFAEGTGGLKHPTYGTYVPTVYTALFLLAGKNSQKRIALLSTYFSPTSKLIKSFRLLPLKGNPFKEDTVLEFHPKYFASLFSLPYEYLQSIELENFPVTPFTTNEQWSDLCFNERELEALSEVRCWLKYVTKLQEDTLLGKSHRGVKVLFYGPPGTGKSISVGLLGKELGLPVYRVDISQLISKWVGETEKNLNRLFTLASAKQGILFFDEGDALFGKRSDKSEGNEHHSNQEVSYLLQRIEEYNGLVFLCTNKQTNMDEAFKRRFNSRVEFSLPSSDNRRQLWKRYLSSFHLTLSEYAWASIATSIVVSGASIKNCCKWLLIKNYQSNTDTPFSADELERLLVSYFLRQEGLRIELTLS